MIGAKWVHRGLDRQSHGRSDDANGFTVDGTALWLRVARTGRGYAFHASADGAWWHFVRQFSLGEADVQVGFEVQSPTGDGLAAAFSDLVYAPTGPGELRDGS